MPKDATVSERMGQGPPHVPGPLSAIIELLPPLTHHHGIFQLTSCPGPQVLPFTFLPINGIALPGRKPRGSVDSGHYQPTLWVIVTLCGEKNHERNKKLGT